MISATNAFGTGIDKENVRLVIHSDIPGSLENYLQEAGRAGRDTEEAECILLYDEADIEEQFRLSTNSRLSKKDLAQILRGLRKAKRNREGNVVITAGELIRDKDIDADQYELIALLAGKSIGDRARRLSMLAVGDDDQSIYGFRKAGVTFIRKFREDYDARVFHLVENFRSTHPIIEVSNRLIEANTDRMKTQHPITINRARQNENNVESEPIGEDAVRLIEVPSLMEQAVALAGEIEKERSLNPSLDYGDIAVLARNGLEHRMLLYARGGLSAKGIPVSLPLNKRCGFSLFRVRGIKSFLTALEGERDRTERASQLIEEHLCNRDCENNQWNRMLLDNLTGWQSETGDATVYISRLIHFLRCALLDQKREQRMGKGVFLSTVHGVKGMEFPVVFMLDGGWRSPKQKDDCREEFRQAVACEMWEVPILEIAWREGSNRSGGAGSGGEEKRSARNPTNFEKNTLNRV